MPPPPSCSRRRSRRPLRELVRLPAPAHGRIDPPPSGIRSLRSRPRYSRCTLGPREIHADGPRLSQAIGRSGTRSPASVAREKTSITVGSIYKRHEGIYKSEGTLPCATSACYAAGAGIASIDLATLLRGRSADGLARFAVKINHVVFHGDGIVAIRQSSGMKLLVRCYGYDGLSALQNQTNHLVGYHEFSLQRHRREK